ncbi:macrolide family glycosyltransferase [Paenibacillus sp. J22TS3]|uniref:macrolide family glycosyltransferase n=1 Tax=Paenibacillus sp. J22TS3 TaxID=2807192 RepID=UPI001B041111|nr:macrolide family glycosyltransferase [Paenibacillus sp. J22TS3]GIP23114.1 glycosyl transferase [Paenibacillus sp. J22TS3]
MANVLFLSIPSHGHVNPSLGLVSELVRRGEKVIYFSSEDFKEKVERTGAIFQKYNEDLNIFKMEGMGGLLDSLSRIAKASTSIVDDMFSKIAGVKFDYMIYSAAFPFGNVVAKILQIPSISTWPVFTGLKEILDDQHEEDDDQIAPFQEILGSYQEASSTLEAAYSINLPDNIMHLLFNRGDMNLVYTSEYFISESDREFLEQFFDGKLTFIGPPVYDRHENLDFPFEKLAGKQVLYISLGTVFSSSNLALYDIFFKSFADWDGVVVMAAHNVNLTQFEIPDHFIVRNYVPQCEILKVANAAITHAGMNTISDLMYYQVPFAAIPLGADQPKMARRAEELGAAIYLDAQTLTPENAIEQVMSDSSYLENMGKISDSFKSAGGYKKAVDEIFMMKKETGIEG